jgi:1-acyl-sn-glycerol-3-phosphate acyltransferase
MIRFVFLALFARPLARFMTGADVIGAEHLPKAGPAIIAANHNSHVDTPLISWFSRVVVGIVPVERTRAGSGGDVLAPMREALAAGDIVILFPEGTRGDASDEMGEMKTGVARLAAEAPHAPVIPVWIEGAGRVLPKGAGIPVPMNCTVLIGEPLAWTGERLSFMAALRERLMALKAQAPPQHWS